MLERLWNQANRRPQTVGRRSREGREDGFVRSADAAVRMAESRLTCQRSSSWRATPRRKRRDTRLCVILMVVEQPVYARPVMGYPSSSMMAPEACCLRQ